jgi:hypothetical protein
MISVMVNGGGWASLELGYFAGAACDAFFFDGEGGDGGAVGFGDGLAGDAEAVL